MSPSIYVGGRNRINHNLFLYFAMYFTHCLWFGLSGSTDWQVWLAGSADWLALQPPAGGGGMLEAGGWRLEAGGWRLVHGISSMPGKGSRK